MESKIQTIEQFKAAAASFLATVETLNSLRAVREQFAPLNAAICDNCKDSRAFTIPPSEWDTCDAVIAAYKTAFARLHGRPEPAPVAKVTQ